MWVGGLSLEVTVRTVVRVLVRVLVALVTVGALAAGEGFQRPCWGAKLGLLLWKVRS